MEKATGMRWWKEKGLPPQLQKWVQYKKGPFKSSENDKSSPRRLHLSTDHIFISTAHGKESRISRFAYSCSIDSFHVDPVALPTLSMK